MPGCANCGQDLKPCPCTVWWCNGVIHEKNRVNGASHFCYLGNQELIAVESA